MIFTYSSGNNAATALFSRASNGDLEITVTNTKANTNDIANGICQVQFTINTSTVGAPTAFTELMASKIVTVKNGPGTVTGPFDYTPPATDPNLHWSFVPSHPDARTFNLVNVSGGGLTGPGGQPVELIIAANSQPSSNSPQAHNPSFNGSATFFLADSLVPADLKVTDITGVSFSFGTEPETLLACAGPGVYVPPVNPNVGAVPEPATGVMALSALAALAFVRFGKRCGSFLRLAF